MSLYWERYVCIADREHPDLVDGLTLEKFVALPHLAVTRDAGMIDVALASRGLRRRVTMQVPFFSVVPVSNSRQPVASLCGGTDRPLFGHDDGRQVLPATP